MKQLIDRIYEALKNSKYNTTIFDVSSYKNKQLIPSEDENKNFIIARLGRHFFWRLKGKSNKVDDYIEASEHYKDSYWLNVYNGDPRYWEADKHREAMKIGDISMTKTKKGVLRLDFLFSDNKLYVSCSPGVQQTKKLGTYDVEDNPVDKEYKDKSQNYKK